MAMKRRVSSYVQDSKMIKNDSIVEQGYISYLTIPSLESMAIMSVLTRLWKQFDFKVPFYGFCSGRGGFGYQERQENIRQIEEAISEKVSHLSLPNSLKTKITDVSRPIGLQILKWTDNINKNYSSFHNSVEHLSSTHWTMAGTIDKVETLKFQIDNRQLTENILDEIFMIACNYCLEDYIHNLWAQIPQKLTVNERFKLDDYKNHLRFYWTSVLRNDLPELMNMLKPVDYSDLYNCNHSINVNMLTWSVFQGNAIALKYFWYKLSEEEKRENTVKWVERVMIKNRGARFYWDYLNTNEYTDILCFLLSHLHEDQQRDIFKKYSGPLLKVLFMDWPWQKFLVPTIQVMWDYLDEKMYVALMSNVMHQIQRRGSVEKILRELWCISPKHFKKCFIQYILKGSFGRLLEDLLLMEDVEIIKLLLNDANAEERRQFIFGLITYQEGTHLFKLIYTGKVHVLEMLVEDILSENEMVDFKKKLALVIGHKLCHDWVLDDNWQAVEKFLEWNFSSQSEVDYFKSDVIKKIGIIDDLIRKKDFKIMNKFMSWCANSEEEIEKFQRELRKRMKHCSVVL